MASRAIVFHGKRGELRQRYREGQEDQFGALGLVRQHDRAVEHSLHAGRDRSATRRGLPRPGRGQARLSPLGHEHINMLGRYSFSIPESVARGELRPLRNPSDPAP